MLAFVLAGGLLPASGATQWRQGFEGDTTGWTIEGGAWEIGIPTAATGPSAFGGAKVAGTVLAGNYGATLDARLITPAFVVPAAIEAPRFTYQYWYSIGANDYGQLQIRVEGGAWQDLAAERLTSGAGRGSWARRSVDLRGYAGQAVQLGFRFVAAFSNVGGDFALGWYLDEAGLETGPRTLVSPEGFESGWGDWSVEGGVWQVGVPTGAGGPAAFRGTNVVGTILSGNYGATHEARLVTPEITVPAADETPRFTYHYWYSIGANDYGQLQIRPVGGAWQDVPGERLTEASPGGWARRSVDLRAYAGQAVQLGFRLVAAFSNVRGDFAPGWYLDEAGLETGPMTFATPEGFESGWADWSVEGGVWQVGVPTGAGGPAAFEGRQVAGTILAGNYGATRDARLVTPEFLVPAASLSPRFAYSYWYALGRSDHGQLQIKSVGGAWQDVPGERLTDSGGRWVRRSVDLRSFAGQAVQLGFRLVTEFGNYIGDTALGWYLDQARLETGPMTLASPEGFEGGFGDWSAEGGVWQIGPPTAVGGPGAFVGAGVAGTILAGNYPGNADARLVTPEFVVPPALRAPQLSFQHWRSLQANDRGRLEISVVNGPWVRLADFAGSDASWKRHAIDLTPYAGLAVRFGFHFTSDASVSGAGWYIDEIRVGALDPVSLMLGTTANGTLPASGARALFAIEVPPGGHLRLHLDDLDGQGLNEVYLRRGAVPTAGAYDRRSAAPGADQTLFAPDAAPGTWYVLVLGSAVPEGGSAYRLGAEFARGVAITGLSPARVGNAFPAQFEVAGAGFAPGVQVDLRDGPRVVATGVVTRIESGRVEAGFNLTGVVPGSYALTLARSGDAASWPVEVVAGGLPRFWANLVAPGRVGRHARATIFVEYGNTGEVAMPAPLLIVHGSDRALLTLDPALSGVGLWARSYPAGYSDTVQLLAAGSTPGLLQPGERLRVPVYYVGLVRPWSFIDVAVQFDLAIVEPTDPSPIEWTHLKDPLRPAVMPTAAWDTIWANFTSGAGATAGEYVTMLADNARYLGRLGLNVVAAADLLTFELAQAEGLNPVEVLAVAPDVRVAQPGIDLAFTRVFTRGIAQRHRVGALGRGWSHNWDFSASTAPDGTVTLTGPGGGLRAFQPDERGGFFNQPGDFARLTSRPGGGYELREPDGTGLAFGADGRFLRVEDSNGNRVTADYSGGVLSSLTHSAGGRLVLTGAAGRIQRVTDAVGRGAEFTYDVQDHLVQATATPGRVLTTYRYEADHALASISAPGGVERRFGYDARGRLTSIAGAAAPVVTFAYDSAGQVTARGADDREMQCHFDHRARLARLDAPPGQAASFAFTGADQLASVTAPGGATTQLSYDRSGNLTRLLDASGRAVTLTYSAEKRLAGLTVGRGRTAVAAHDAAGNLATVTYPDDTRESITRDAQGAVITWRNRRGQTTRFTRDAAGRVVRKQTPEGRTYDYSYDDRGRLVGILDSTTGPARFTYDDRDRLIGLTEPGDRTFAFTYDDAGRRTSRTGPDGYTLKYAYDDAGRLSRVEDGSGRRVIEYAYDLAGRVLRESRGNGTRTEHTYDPSGRLVRWVNLAPDGLVSSQFDYTYDAAGLVASVASPAGTTRYEYDPSGQLVAVAAAGGRTTRFTYDDGGNRVEVTTDGTLVRYTVNALGQYTGVGAASFAYDADGNLVTRTDATGTTTCVYDSENRLVRVESPVSGTWSFVYDALGRRTSTTRNGETTTYLHDPANPLELVAEYGPGGALVARYDHGVGLAGRIDADGRAAYYAYDALGNTRELTDDAGTVVNRYDYEPFGEVTTSVEGVPNPFVFGGRHGVMRSADGGLAMGLRQYDPHTGRFTSVDPIRFESGDPNLYRYAANNPVNFNDPSGLFFPVGSAAGAIIGGLGNTAGLLYSQWASGEPLGLNWTSAGRLANAFAAGAVNGAIIGGTGGLGLLAGAGVSTGVGLSSGLIDNWLAGKALNTEAWLNLGLDSVLGLVPMKGLPQIAKWGSGNFQRGLLGLLQAANDHGQRLWRELFAGTLMQQYLKQLGNILGLDKLISAIAAAVDPNELLGPAGFGAANHLRGDDTLAYRLNFENDRAASATAQMVEIRNQIPAPLDPGTLEFSSAGFGEVLIPIPPGAQRFEHTETVALDGVTFDVTLELWIDALEGEVRARFWSVSPDSGLPPPVETGFLPPEDGTGRGMGHIAYLVRPRLSLPTGTEIRNVGFVTFDRYAGGPTFRTDLRDPHDPQSPPDPGRQALVSIDADAPASRIAALAADSGVPNFPVTWSGTDLGAGITGYDIYAQTDGGAWVPWLQDTSATSAVWAGDYGRTYGFYSVAHDGVGFGEPAPTAATVAQARTMVPPRSGYFSGINVSLTGNGVSLDFVGVPGESWRIERASALGGAWRELEVVVLGPEGRARFSDVDPPAAGAFYRAVK